MSRDRLRHFSQFPRIGSPRCWAALIALGGVLGFTGVAHALCPGGTAPVVFWMDRDGDGYGGTRASACAMPDDAAGQGGDCNDANANVHPGAPELCNGADEDCDGSIDEGVKLAWYKDGDKDGYGLASATTQACSQPSGYVSRSGDCNDASSTVNPGASESCNGVDDDCDGGVDEGVKATWYWDGDHDTYGLAGSAAQACAKPSGYAARAGDCNDANYYVNPSATETCNGTDDDCEGGIDEGVKAHWYKDADGDSYGLSSTTTLACAQPAGYTGRGGDCNDQSAASYPGARETCDLLDNNCDGVIDEGVKSAFYKDADGDGFGTSATTTTACAAPTGYVSNATDCNDQSAAINPGANELCNDTDDDCDGAIDDGVSKSTYYQDADGDSYGSTTVSVAACARPVGYQANSGDCDDTRAAVNPGAAEVCNGLDDNCSGGIDEGLTKTFYKDADGDTWGSNLVWISACTMPAGYANRTWDCDDTNPAVYPGATETCNTIDDNCMGGIDEGLTTTFYADADGDGSGAASIVACTMPAGYVTLAGDCNDSNAAIRPGAVETCDGLDNDCNAVTDDGVQTLFADADGDGYGDADATALFACNQTPASGYVATAGDCDDAHATAHPGETEVCDLLDNDCDGAIDESVQNTFYLDADADGYGTATTTQACTRPDGYATVAGDCKDSDATIHPKAPESCNGVDEDCDNQVDEGVTLTFYKDQDADGYGSNTTVKACAMPVGYATIAGDCNDSNAAVHPKAVETCNGQDDNCAGGTDEDVKTTYYLDGDADGYGRSSVLACAPPAGYVATKGDCNDADASINPGASERCNGVDDDCDGTIDDATLTYYPDADGDGSGDEAGALVITCSEAAPSGSVLVGGDCDDANSNVHPNLVELCDQLDNDCDGAVDVADLGTGCSVCDPLCAGACRIIGGCDGRDVIACDFGNYQSPPYDETSFDDMAAGCADRGAEPVTVRSQSDDACIATALLFDPGHYYVLGFNSIDQPGAWRWESGRAGDPGLFIPPNGDGLLHPWDPKYADPGENVIASTVELIPGTTLPYLYWGSVANTAGLRYMVCERER